jgi:hypothetical protein
MEDYYEHMFYVPLIHIESRNWEKKQKLLLDQLNKTNLSLCDDITTDYFNGTKNLNNFIQELFNDELDLFLEKINYKTKEIHSSWFEISKTGNHHVVHNHGFYGYSAVCFIKFNENVHKPTIFLSPFFNFLNGNVLEHIPSVNEGSIIFFPSAIMHYTRPNTSDQDRIILSFNIRD